GAERNGGAFGKIPTCLIPGNYLFVVGEGLERLLICRQAITQHVVRFEQQVIVCSLCCQPHRFTRYGNRRCRLRIAGLPCVKVETAYVSPKLLEGLPQFFAIHGVMSFLNLSRQRARVGPMLATSIPRLAAISA